MKQARLRPHVLLTGPPRSGKTTLLARIVSLWPGRCGGFITEEIREAGSRVGFRLRTLEGREGILASVNLASPYRVGRYGVDVESLERVGVEAIYNALASKEIVVIDEIGKMELYSKKFQEAVLTVLDSPCRLLGVIHMARIPVLDRIRQRPDVRVLEVNGQNNDQVGEEVISLIEEQKRA